MFHQTRFVTGAFIGLNSLILYSMTMARDVMAHDPAEWQASAITLGINHAPGSPAYTLIGRLLTLFPLGNPAGRVTFLSVVVATAGVVATYAFVLLLLDRLLPAVIAAATLALAGVWWANATVPGPYNVVPAVMAGLLLLLLLWSRSGDVRLIWAGALLAGVSLAYHPLVMFFLPVPVAGMFLVGPWRSFLRLKPVLIALLLFAAGLSIYLYLPIRSAANPPIMAQKIDSVSTFLDYVSASHARDTKLRESFLPGFSEIKDRLDEVVYFSYNPAFLAVILLPAGLLFVPALWRELRPLWRWLVLLAAAMIVQMFLLFIGTDVYDHYYLPLLFYFAVWAGVAIFLLLAAFDRMWGQTSFNRAMTAVTVTCIAVLLLLGIPRIWSFANHSGDRDMRDYINAVFTDAKPGAVVIANWESFTGLEYAQKIEGQRPDISLYSATNDEAKALLPQIVKEQPGAEVMMSFSFNIYGQQEIDQYGWEHPLSIKALTYQDFNHGPPYPVEARLEVLRKG